MNDTIKSSIHHDERSSLQDLTKRLIAAELHAEMAEINAVAAERARAAIHAELRAVQSERDTLRMETAGLKARLEHAGVSSDANVISTTRSKSVGNLLEDLLFSWSLAQPLGEVADFDILHHNGHSLVVHPVAFETVVVELSFSFSEPVSMIKMEANLPDAQAQAVEYALVAAGEPVTADSPVEKDIPWDLLSPSEMKEVTFDLPAEGRKTIVLLYLRVSDPAKGHDYCGTQWRIFFAA